MILQARAFEGRWQLARRIHDRLARQDGVMSGVAEFVAEGPLRLSYEEQGELRLGRGPAMQARRRYLWLFDAGQVQVLFEDGRDFHRFTPEGAGRGTDHPCGDDIYTVEYDFTRWPIWTATWDVKGPRKDYRFVSTYIRG